MLAVLWGAPAEEVRGQRSVDAGHEQQDQKGVEHGDDGGSQRRDYAIERFQAAEEADNPKDFDQPEYLNLVASLGTLVRR